jgi:hypothetical protein
MEEWIGLLRKHFCKRNTISHTLWLGLDPQVITKHAMDMRTCRIYLPVLVSRTDFVLDETRLEIFAQQQTSSHVPPSALGPGHSF